jgi:hypothetical protein
VSVAVKA